MRCLNKKKGWGRDEEGIGRLGEIANRDGFVRVMFRFFIMVLGGGSGYRILGGWGRGRNVRDRRRVKVGWGAEVRGGGSWRCCRIRFLVGLLVNKDYNSRFKFWVWWCKLGLGREGGESFWVS